VPQLFGRPSQFDLSVVKFLPNRVFNSNRSLQFCIMFHAYFVPWKMGGQMSPIGKSQTFSLFCFVLVQIQTDFPMTDQEISLKSPVFPSDKTFSK
jgi:hypothetical protein